MKTKDSAALISVTDKSGLEKLADAFVRAGIGMLGSSGTKKHLEDRGIECQEISSYTGSPEILDGRVKTLHPKIHGGILADRGNRDHVKTLLESGIRPIDFVVVNLYPFEEKYRSESLTTEELVEFIDIGGIALIRAAAKNFAHVTVVTDPGQYDAVIAEMDRGGTTSPEMRVRLASQAFALTATYDAAIHQFFRSLAPPEPLPERLPIGLVKVADARYGENPHQHGGLYRTAADSAFLKMVQHQGKELSFNNYLDIAGGFNLARDLGRNCVGIVKHTNPCGAGWCGEVTASFRRALACDPTSAFGGIVSVNGTVTEVLARELMQIFFEVVIARGYEQAAIAAFAKRKNLRVVTIPDRYWDEDTAMMTAVLLENVVLYQDRDSGFPELDELKQVTERAPSNGEIEALRMGWKTVKHVKSNAIVIADRQGTVGIGAGQMSRVDSARIATRKAFDAKLSLAGTAAASDAFFPFPDGVTELAKAGVTAIIQPGGSVRDQEVINAANETNLAMLFTGRRHFRHL